jgi:DNA end-binding protein Ku
MAEPTWNGFLRLSLVSCRVYLSPATSDRKWVRLEPLNPKTGNPVVPGFVDARTGEIVPADGAGQAHQFENGRYVSLGEGELRQLAGPPSQVIDIDSFIPQDSIDRLFFESFYYIYPDEPLGGDTLFTLRTAMLRNGKAGLGHMHIGGRQRRVLVEPRGTGLMLTVLRSADQLEDVEFEARADTDVPVELIEVAESLIARRSSSVDPARFDDAYQEGLRVLVADKVRAARGGSAASASTTAASAIVANPPAAARGAAELPPAALAREPEPAPTVQPAVAEPIESSEPVALAEVPSPLAEAEEEPIYAGHAEPPSVAGEPGPPSYAAAEVPEAEAVLASPLAAEVAQPEPLFASPPAAAVAEPEPPAPEPEAPLPQAAAAAEAAVAETGAEREVGSEIFLHIIGLGERRYVGSGWAGTPGSRQPIEALSIRPAESLPRNAVEFRVFARDGRATSWVTDGNYAGSWGRRLPLTGFAVRPTEGHGDEVEILYEGYFSEGGVVGPKRDGEVCQSSIADDPLEAVLVRILERAA